jgi:glycosyltransferase involved in cell wall biosynthesis
MTEVAILVVTTVHAADDTRIRERLIRSLEGVGAITYATRVPGPADRSGLDWVPLPGGRLARNLKAMRMMLDKKWRLVILHDPETIPAGVLARLIRRRPVVFDVHEDLAAQIVNKEWVPLRAKSVFRWLARVLYRMAERTLLLTLAEPSYRTLFGRPHPVFANYPRTSVYPDPVPSGNGSAVYLGDVTRVRGVEDALLACGLSGRSLTAVGRVDHQLAATLQSRAAARGTALTLTGRLPNPHALRLVAAASVGLSPLRDVENYRNSLPTKTLEYLAMGVPVVASDLPGTRTALGDLEAVWLVPPGDTKAMAEAIGEASTAEAKAAAMAQVGAVRDRFRWPEEEVRAFYLALLGRSENRAPN